MCRPGLQPLGDRVYVLSAGLGLSMLGCCVLSAFDLSEIFLPQLISLVLLAASALVSVAMSSFC